MPTETWEYMTRFVRAHIDNPGAREFLKETFPNWTDPPKFAPETMMPLLNKLGAKGWELVHMEPVRAVGKNDDVLFQSGGDIASRDWSNTYFCVFKRKIVSEE